MLYPSWHKLAASKVVFSVAGHCMMSNACRLRLASAEAGSGDDDDNDVDDADFGLGAIDKARLKEDIVRCEDEVIENDAAIAELERKRIALKKDLKRKGKRFLKETGMTLVMSPEPPIPLPMAWWGCPRNSTNVKKSHRTS